MRPEEWSTVLLPELGLERRRPGESTVFAVQACAKYGKRREIYVPAGALDAVETPFLLLERPQIVGSGRSTTSCCLVTRGVCRLAISRLT